MNIYDFLEYILGGNHMQPSKRVDIVSVKLVKEASILYKNRRIRSPQDCYELFKEFLGRVDREYFVVMCLDVKNQPTNISMAHIGSLNVIFRYCLLNIRKKKSWECYGKQLTKMLLKYN